MKSQEVRLPGSYSILAIISVTLGHYVLVFKPLFLMVCKAAGLFVMAACLILLGVNINKVISQHEPCVFIVLFLKNGFVGQQKLMFAFCILYLGPGSLLRTKT